jgi:hypothetical protein
MGTRRLEVKYRSCEGQDQSGTQREQCAFRYACANVRFALDSPRSKSVVARFEKSADEREVERSIEFYRRNICAQSGVVIFAWRNR